MREYTSTMEKQIHEKTENGIVWRGIVDRGPMYRDETGKQHRFIGEDGRNYIGLLNSDGHPLKLGEPLHILWFQHRKASDDEAESN